MYIACLLVLVFQWFQVRSLARTLRLQLDLIKSLQLETRQTRAVHSMQIRDLRADLTEHWHDGIDNIHRVRIPDPGAFNAWPARFPVRGPMGPTGPNG